MTEAVGRKVDRDIDANANNNLYLILILYNLVDQRPFTFSIEDDRPG